MIGSDTNVLVRYIMQDDAKPAALANKLIEGLTEASPGYISQVAIVEWVWVLELVYELTPGAIGHCIQSRHRRLFD